MSAYTGQNFGAKRFDRIGEVLKVCLFIALTAYAVLGTVMTFFPEWLASRLLSGREQITYAAEFLPICGAMLFAVDMLFVFRNAARLSACSDDLGYRRNGTAYRRNIIVDRSDRFQGNCLRRDMRMDRGVGFECISL